MKTNTVKHTETPWMMQGYQNNGYNIGTDQGSSYEKVAWGNNEANAEFIVMAVNAHDSLVTALRNIFDHTQGECEHKDMESCNAEIKRLAEEALSKAV